MSRRMMIHAVSAHVVVQSDAGRRLGEAGTDARIGHYPCTPAVSRSGPVGIRRLSRGLVPAPQAAPFQGRRCTPNPMRFSGVDGVGAASLEHRARMAYPFGGFFPS